MKWSELPEVYRHLKIGKKEAIRFNDHDEDLAGKFTWCNTIQGFSFWANCCDAKKEDDLPLIEPKWITNYCVKPFESVFIIGGNNATEVTMPWGKLDRTKVDIPKNPDPVNHPAHYGGKDNVYEAIKIIEHFDLGFHLGNVIEYVLRAGKKGDPITDLKKAAWYLDAKIKQMQLIRYKGLNPGFDPNNCTYAESQKFNEWLKSE